MFYIKIITAYPEMFPGALAFSWANNEPFARSVVAMASARRPRRRKMGVDMECGLWKGTVASVDERPL